MPAFSRILTGFSTKLQYSLPAFQSMAAAAQVFCKGLRLPSCGRRPRAECQLLAGPRGYQVGDWIPDLPEGILPEKS
jgi:hypothetical protein